VGFGYNCGIPALIEGLVPYGLNSLGEIRLIPRRQWGKLADPLYAGPRAAAQLLLFMGCEVI